MSETLEIFFVTSLLVRGLRGELGEAGAAAAETGGQQGQYCFHRPVAASVQGYKRRERDFLTFMT